VRQHKLTLPRIESVDIFKVAPDGGRPFTKADYAALPRVKIASPAVIAEVYRMLLEHTKDGTPWKDHPAGVYYGMLRLNCVSGEHYYIYYSLRYRDEYYILLDANSANEDNPNCAKRYHSRRLVSFLRNHDPWFAKDQGL
jgi:hypothetical protein